MTTKRAFYGSPLGALEITVSKDCLIGVHFCAEKDRGESDKDPLLRHCTQQLDEYFAGKRTDFDLPLSLIGTDFQQSVWQLLLDIPYGEVWSYADLARAIGKPKAFRAVGNANNKNNISIIVPCHRVIGSDHSLTGYAGGVWRKSWLLEREGMFSRDACLKWRKLWVTREQPLQAY